MKYHRFITIILVFFTISLLTSCGGHKFGDQRKMEANVKDRVRKNIEEGKGVRFGSISPKSGVFNFSTSNPLWRATIESLSFMPLSSADYGGGIIITDWYSSGDSKNEEIKITVRFTSNEIRADAVQIFLHKRICKVDQACKIVQIESEIKNSLKMKILKKAALLEKTKPKDFERNSKAPVKVR